MTISNNPYKLLFSDPRRPQPVSSSTVSPFSLSSLVTKESSPPKEIAISTIHLSPLSSPLSAEQEAWQKELAAVSQTWRKILPYTKLANRWQIELTIPSRSSLPLQDATRTLLDSVSYYKKRYEEHAEIFGKGLNKGSAICSAIDPEKASHSLSASVVDLGATLKQLKEDLNRVKERKGDISRYLEVDPDDPILKENFFDPDRRFLSYESRSVQQLYKIYEELLNEQANYLTQSIPCIEGLFLHLQKGGDLFSKDLASCPAAASADSE